MDGPSLRSVPPVTGRGADQVSTNVHRVMLLPLWLTDFGSAPNRLCAKGLEEEYPPYRASSRAASLGE